MSRSLPFAALLLSLPFTASADVVHLKNGRTLEGESERTEKGILVRRDFGTVLIPHRDVDRVEIKETPRQIYQRRLKALKIDDVEGHLGLAEFCIDRGMTKRARALALGQIGKPGAGLRLARVLTALEFHQVNGVWQPPEVYYPAQGYERIDGRWLPPERARVVKASRALRELEKHVEVLAKQLAYEEGNLAAAKRRLRRAEQALEDELADQLRLDGWIAAGEVELRRREQDLDHAEARALQARNLYLSWNRRRCLCEDPCECGWARRRLQLQRSCNTCDRSTVLARAARDKASAHLQSLHARKADGPNRIVSLEGRIGDAEAALPKVEQRLTAARAAYRKGQADLVKAEAELEAAKDAKERARAE